MAKTMIAILLSLAVMAVAAVGGLKSAGAAIPAPACAKGGQQLPPGTSRYNTVLVKLWVFDKNSQPVTTGGFSLVRIGAGNKHIPVDGLAVPNCWTLFRLPNFSRKTVTLCVVVREHYRAVQDPAFPGRPPACPTPTFDRVSGLYTYKAYLQGT